MLNLLGKFDPNCCFHSNQNLDRYCEYCGEQCSIEIPNELFVECLYTYPHICVNTYRYVHGEVCISLVAASYYYFSSSALL